MNDYNVICGKGNVIVREILSSDNRVLYYIVRYIDSLDHQRSKQFEKLDQALRFYESKKEL